MSGGNLPSFEELEAGVLRTFVHPARMIPERFEFWTCPTDDLCLPVVQKRTRCQAHISVDLAVPVKRSTPSLQLLCGYIEDYLSPIIVIEEDTWTDSGAFEVCCFVPDFEVDADSGEKKIVYRRGADMEFQLNFGKAFEWKRRGVFQQLDTLLEPNLFERAADLFKDFLTLEFTTHDT